MNTSRRHRTAKQAQRDSTELFEALYFSKNPARIFIKAFSLHFEFVDYVVVLDGRAAEDGVIYSFRKNGFMVLLPQYAPPHNNFAYDVEVGPPKNFAGEVLTSPQVRHPRRDPNSRPRRHASTATGLSLDPIGILFAGAASDGLLPR